MLIDTMNDSLPGSLAGAELRSIDRIVALFQLCVLPPRLWTHRVRMAIGLRYVLCYGFEEGLRRFRSRVRDYQRATGTGADFHETEIVYSMWVLSEFRRRHPLIRHRILLHRRLLEDRICDPGFVRRAYSPEAWNAAVARRLFVEPDRMPLPAAVRHRLRRISVRHAAICTTIPGTVAVPGPRAC